jgi:hypothetical protein
VKCIRGILIMCLWVSERFDHLMEFNNRAGHAVRNDQGQSVRMRRTDVKEMYPQSVDHSFELGETVEPLLALPPVILL